MNLLLRDGYDSLVRDTLRLSALQIHSLKRIFHPDYRDSLLYPNFSRTRHTLYPSYQHFLLKSTLPTLL